MLKYNFKIALRNILKFPAYAAINVIGLSTGVVISFIIFIYLSYETSFDQFYPDHDRISRLTIQYDIGGKIDQYANAPRPMGPNLKNDFPEIVSFTRMRGAGSLVAHRAYVTYNENSFESEQIFIVDSTFFQVFKQPLIHGDPKTALVNPGSIAISEDLAFKLFGNDQAVGKRIEVENRGGTFEVTAVFENVPENTHMPYEALISWSGYYPPGANTSWIGRHVYTYFLFEDESGAASVKEKFPGFYEKHMKSTFDGIGGSATIFFQPLAAIHLTSQLIWEAYPNGNKTTLYLFGAVAIFLLLIAIINYINLTTAKASGRFREVGIRKSIGAQKSSIVAQLLSESVFIAVFSFFLAIILGFLLSPFADYLLGIPVYTQFFSSSSIVQLFLLSVSVGVLSGIYPAYVISGQDTIKVLRGKFHSGKKGSSLRKMLVTIQLSASIFVIIGTLVVAGQMSFIKNKDLGFNKDNILVAHLKDTAVQHKILPLKTDLMAITGIDRVASAFALPDKELNQTVAFVENSDGSFDQQGLQFLPVDPDLFRVLDMEIVDGRNFILNSEADRNNSLIINEAAARRYGFYPDPLNKRIHFGADNEGNIHYYNIIGIIKDFHSGSLQFNIEPVIIYYEELNRSGGEWLFVKIPVENTEQLVASVKSVIDRYDPQTPIKYNFLDENFNSLYQQEQALVEMMGYLSIIIIVISSLGLLGLISFTIVQRAREVAIRKVLGANAKSVIVLISKNFLLLAIISNIIAWPLAYWVMDGWLQNFAYRMELSLQHFLLAGILSLILVMLTIAYHTLKIGGVQPAQSLKEE